MLPIIILDLSKEPEDSYYHINDDFFKKLEDSRKNVELNRFHKRQKELENLKENNPIAYVKLINVLSDAEKDLILFNRIKKEYVNELYRDPENTTCKSFDRHYKDGTPEKGEYTTYNILANNVSELITLIYLNNQLQLPIIFNPEASHMEQNLGKNGANSHPDFVMKNGDTPLFIELQITLCSGEEEFNKRNCKTELTYKSSKFYEYIRQIGQHRPVIHCEKIYDVNNKQVKYYFYDMAKLLNSRDITRITCNKDNYMDLYNTGKISLSEKNFFIATGSHTRVFIKNIPDDIVCEVQTKNSIDLKQYMESLDAALSNDYLKKQANILLNKDFDNITKKDIDQLINEATNKKYIIDDYRNKNDELLHKMNQEFEK